MRRINVAARSAHRTRDLAGWMNSNGTPGSSQVPATGTHSSLKLAGNRHRHGGYPAHYRTPAHWFAGCPAEKSRLVFNSSTLVLVTPSDVEMEIVAIRCYSDVYSYVLDPIETVAKLEIC